MSIFLLRCWRLLRNERGITGLETAIVLIAFVVVSSVFAFAALSAGLFSTDKSEGTFDAALSEARGTMELRGSIMGRTNATGDAIDRISFQVANAAGGEPIDLTPGATVIRYIDSEQQVMFDTGSKLSATPMGNADSDNLLESGEMYELALLSMETNLSTKLANCTSFLLEVMPPKGAVLHLKRTTPTIMEKYNDLNRPTRCGDGAAATPTPASTPTPAPTPTPTPTPSPTTQTFTSVADSWVYGNSPSANYGTSTEMEVKSDNGQNGRSFVRFDVSSVPGGSTVSSATLTLCATEVAVATRTYELHRVAASWVETSVNWSNQPGVSGGATDSATTPATPACMTWTVTTDVQAWVDGTANDGWRAKDASEDSSTTYRTVFRTREEAVVTSARPKLEVTYTQ